jgi:serine/threonine protein kinase
LSLPGHTLVSPSEYKLIKQLAKGGGGSVFLAEPLSPNLKSHGEILVAKVISTMFDEMNGSQKVAFQQEVAISYFLKSNGNTAKFIGFCTKPQCCILMKYYPEGSLDKLIHSKKTYTKNILVRVLLNITNGLKSMHDLLIAHCDIKPQNVLLDRVESKLVGMLTDFGIANVLSDSLVEVKAFKIANLKGLSVSYASPETFVRLKNSLPDKPNVVKAGDVYSIGIVIHEMLRRRLPWSYFIK